MAVTADTYLRVWGLAHLYGATVGCTIAGIDMGNYTVNAQGYIDVPYGADADGTVTVAYLVANFTTGSGALITGSAQDTVFNVYTGSGTVSVTVPVIAGLIYTTTGQFLRPITTDALLGERGPALGKMRRSHKVAMFVEGVQELKIGTSISNLLSVPMTSDGGLTPELALDDDEPFTGVIVQPLQDGPSYDTQFMWRVSRPYRCTLSMVSAFIVGV